MTANKRAEDSEKIVLSGTVRDERSGAAIAQASVSATGTSISVVTNEDGFFTLKADRLPKGITISHIGYQSRQLTTREVMKSPLNIKLKATAIALDEVVVWTGDPSELVRIAIKKIPENYSRTPELYRGFYRETAMKRQRYIYVAEGVVDMYKTAYTHTDRRDRVAIRKGRRLLSPKKSDTLSVKVTKETYELLRREDEAGRLRFIGNVEARDALFGGVDVLVPDGFSGNILLKGIEGTAVMLMKELKKIFYKNTKNKLAAAMLKNDVYALKALLDPSEVGGTALLGISKPVIKAHGSSDARAVRSAVKQAITFMNAGVIESIEKNIAYMRVGKED